MSSAVPDADRTTVDRTPSKPQRILACVLCQQRKIKCDRVFPCANCIRSQAQCVPAALVRRPRKRRFPERDLLDRLRRYEDLLRQHNVKFEPLHKDAAVEKESPNADTNYDSDEEKPDIVTPDAASPATTVKSGQEYEAKNFWHALHKSFKGERNEDNEISEDELTEETMLRLSDQAFGRNDQLLLLGSITPSVKTCFLHPEPAHIFRLWQFYLDNVDPILKLTHTPTLQGRIIEAAGNTANVPPNLEALMFSIYCVSILSLQDEECQAMFQSSKEDLLTRYQFGCQQALTNCRFLQSNDRDCLTALFLYLTSIGRTTHAQALSSLLGIVVRIAQRMGLHVEASCARNTPLEAELRRRLWWSIALFDARISEFANFKSGALHPNWDCKVPLNVNDSDLRAEMKEPPTISGKTSEALFAVVRSELGEYVRFSAFHLDFTTPALKAVVKETLSHPPPEGGELDAMEKMIEDKYLKFCDPGIPLHFLTIWTSRGYIGRCRLYEHYSKCLAPELPNLTDSQRETAIRYACNMIDCDTTLWNSPLGKGFHWFFDYHFPFLGYLHILHHVRRRPISDLAEQAWDCISDNYETRFRSRSIPTVRLPFFRLFAKMICNTWEVRAVALRAAGEPVPAPRVVAIVQQKLQEAAQQEGSSPLSSVSGADQLGIDMDMDFVDMPMSIAMGFDGDDAIFTGGMPLPGGFGGPAQGMFPGVSAPPGQPTMEDTAVSQLNWAAMNFGERRGW